MRCWPVRSRPILTRLLPLALATLLIAVSTGLALEAELRLREALLAAQQGRVTITAVVVLGEGTSRGFWSDPLYEARHRLAVPVTGAFRIWLEHPPIGNAIQTEGTRVPRYANSNPDHQVELRRSSETAALLAGLEEFVTDRRPHRTPDDSVLAVWEGGAWRPLRNG